MIEGRISAGVIVSKGSDLGGSSSTMGTLSGGGTELCRGRKLFDWSQCRHRFPWRTAAQLRLAYMLPLVLKLICSMKMGICKAGAKDIRSIKPHL